MQRKFQLLLVSPLSRLLKRKEAADVGFSPQVSGAGCAQGFVARQHQHQFEAIAQFILSHPMFYKTKLINSAFVKFC
ncbi:MAG TPA: hypothetical protein VGP55_04195 [Chitinophagaceae bacterium]|nr:hypothetical protein [Chitinophagaceae bacterium]